MLVAEMRRRAVQPRRVIVLLLPEVHLLDLAGPVQAFYEANAFGGAYEILHTAAVPRIRSAQGLVLSELEQPLEPTSRDLVLVPGIDSSTLERLTHVPTAWLRKAHASGARLASICSGAFALGSAGLLDGRVCTTHWKVVRRLAERFPQARVAS